MATIILERDVAYWYGKLGNIRATAKKLKTRTGTVSEALHRLGIRKKRKKHDPKTLERQILGHYERLKHVHKTAKRLKICVSKVSSVLKKHGISTKNGPKAARRPPLNSRQKQLFVSGFPLIKAAIRSIGAWRARKAGLEVDDLHNAGLVGLWRAALAFKRSLGCSFNTLAFRIVRYEMLDALEIARYGRKNPYGHLIDQSAFVRYHEYAEPDEPM